MLVVLPGWIEKVLKQAKIDTGKHKAHSTHSASTSQLFYNKDIVLPRRKFSKDTIKTNIIRFKRG